MKSQLNELCNTDRQKCKQKSHGATRDKSTQQHQVINLTKSNKKKKGLPNEKIIRGSTSYGTPPPFPMAGF
jgi:hypothetical protein